MLFLPFLGCENVGEFQRHLPETLQTMDKLNAGLQKMADNMKEKETASVKAQE